VLSHDLVDAGWTKNLAQETFDSLISAGLILEQKSWCSEKIFYTLKDDFEELAQYHA
jgi:hypothetical protein